MKYCNLYREPNGQLSWYGNYNSEIDAKNGRQTPGGEDIFIGLVELDDRDEPKSKLEEVRYSQLYEGSDGNLLLSGDYATKQEANRVRWTTTLTTTLKYLGLVSVPVPKQADVWVSGYIGNSGILQVSVENNPAQVENVQRVYEKQHYKLVSRKKITVKAGEFDQ